MTAVAVGLPSIFYQQSAGFRKGLSSSLCEIVSCD